MANTNPFLEALIYGVRDLIDGAGNAFVRRSKVKFVGSTIVDNPTTGTTEVTTSGGGGASPGGSDGDVQLKNGAAFAGVSGAKGNVLGYSGTAWQAEPSTVVNIMDYYLVADGAPTVDGHTTKNIGPAFGRAYAATVGLRKHLTLWIPPCDAYGVQAWSWEETQEIFVQTDVLFTLNILGSGQAGIIIPTQIGGLSDKLSFHGAGAAGQPMRLIMRDLFFSGDSTQTTDCNALLITTADMSLVIEDCYFYALESATDALLALECDDLLMKKVQFMNCGNVNADLGAVVYVRSGIWSVFFEQVFFYHNEHRDSMSNPLTPWGTAETSGYFKNDNAPTWHVWIRGDDTGHPPQIKFQQCVFGGFGYGAVWANPDVGLAIESIVMEQCTIRDHTNRTIQSVANVDRIALRDLIMMHNYAVKPSVDILDSTTKNLIMDRCHATHDQIQVRAKTGQSVTVREQSGGDFDVTGASHVVVDEISNFDIFAGAVIDRALRGSSAAGAAVNLIADAANDPGLEYTIPATSTFTLRVELLGSRTDAQGNAREVHEISGHSDATTITIDDDALVTALGGFVAAGWSAPTFTDAGGLVLRVTCAGVAGQNVDFEAHVTGRSRPGHN